jgi:hypothetical protein
MTETTDTPRYSTVGLEDTEDFSHDEITYAVARRPLPQRTSKSD